MKKILCCLLAALLLCGCGVVKGNDNVSSKKENNKKPEIIIEEALSEIGEAKREESFLVLRFTINPEFELFLDEDAFVTKIRCLNADAETLFADLDVLGQEYPTAVETILNAAKAKAFITEETNQIQIQTSIVSEVSADKDSLEALASDLAQPVEEFQENNQLTFTVVSETPVVENPIEEENSNKKEEIGKPNSTHETDIYDKSSKNIVGKFTEYYDENGHHAKDSWHYFGDAIYSDIYVDGHKAESIVELEDGTIVRRTLYRPNGTKISTEETNPNYSSTTLYNEEDLRTSTTQVYADGRNITISYHPNGEQARFCEKNANDGSYSDSIYDENGKSISFIRVDAGGYKTEITFYPGTGVPQWESQTYPDSSCTELFYAEDGTITKAISTWEGGTQETTFHPNGQEAVVIVTGSDYSSETHYDESGNKIYLYHNDGYNEYVIENDFFTYYIQNGEPITDTEYLQDLYDIMKQAAGG